MHTDTINIGEIFGHDRRLMVPLFQRPYVWVREQQWEPLWEDIRTSADRVIQDKPIRPHFLGAIVLDQLPTGVKEPDRRLTIDGQQRLMTIQILLEAFADICASLDVDNYHRALLKLTRNDNPLSDEPDDQYKVWPTNVDQEQFRRVMQAGSPNDLALEGLEPPHLLADAYLFFHQAILGWLAPTESNWKQRLETLYDTLRRNVRMVVIDLEKEDDAQLIFETLNARGTPLLPSDLVKNFLLRRARTEGERLERLYEAYWQPFDTNAGYWRKELGVGRAKRARIDLYLRHYLTLRTRDEVPVAHLYTAFRQYANDDDSVLASAHLQSLRRYAQVYQSFDTFDPSSHEGIFFRRLKQMDVTTTHPFLLELFASPRWMPAQIAQVLTDIESFLVRRLVCHLTTQGYNRLFIEMLDLLDGSPDALAARVREFLAMSQVESRRWPRDAEFREAWSESPLYRLVQRERIRMLLEALERYLYTELTEKLEIKGGLTIEHLMPQGWHRYWPLPVDLPPEEAEIRRETLLHTIGNLTLLTKRLNPKVSNGPWEEKRKEILQHSALTLNRRLDRYHQWSEETILERGEILFEVARQIWPSP